ncbi:MAG TPA: T9SS type A sorting domain-containing protein, partial [Saprospiraceae bacterium]|nr:T9SS type A sorting domain-containing protein [Saprospiraceae bacterium]
NVLYISTGQSLTGQADLLLFGADGREVLRQRLQNGLAEGQVFTLDLQQIPAGVYMLRLSGNAGSSVKTVVVKG